MDRNDLQSKIKPTMTVYLYWFLFGSHYGYLGRWNIQILFWITFGGLGVWAIIDLFTMSDLIVKHRESIFQQIEEIERKEKFEKLTHKKYNHAPKYKLAMVG
jgi:hypothetical protein